MPPSILMLLVERWEGHLAWMWSCYVLWWVTSVKCTG